MPKTLDQLLDSVPSYEEREDLIALVKQLAAQTRKFGLVWEDKPEEVAELCETKLPVLNEVVERHIERNGDATADSLLGDDGSNLPTHLIIEGDNYHALSVLNYTHAGKVDVIYIDPPYNTGSASWKYNNKIVDKEDLFRHSKFLSFMYKRLELAKYLLTHDGIIIVAIDDYEVHSIRFILDELFGEENRLATCVVVHNPGGRQDDRFFATAHEYMLVYSPHKQEAQIGFLEITEEKASQYNQQDEFGRYKLRSLIRTGANSRPVDRPNLYYPIYVNPENLDIAVEKTKGWIELLPKDSSGADRVWRWSPPSLMEQKEKYITCKKIKNGYALFVKEREDDNKGYKPKTLWNKPNYSSATAIGLLKTIFAASHRAIFDYPKSADLMRDILKITSKPNSTILDFFAGSGTTGHAVLELNTSDGGNRQFILCTNNENGIAANVTHPRIKKVIEGYGDKEPIPAEVRYFRTEFVEKDEDDITDAVRHELVERATDMLKIRENTFTLVEQKIKRGKRQFEIYTNVAQTKYTAVIYDTVAIECAKAKLHRLAHPVAIYIFTLGDDRYESDFDEPNWNVEPLPERILQVYKRLFAKRKKKNS